MDAPSLASAFLLREIRSLDEEQWEIILDYLQDHFKEFADMDLDQVEKLDKRQSSILVLEDALKIDKTEREKTSALQYPQILARKWKRKNETESTPKRSRDSLSLLEDLRTKWASNPDRLSNFEKTSSEWNFRVFKTIVADDQIQQPFGVRVPARLFALLSGKLIELFNKKSMQRIYVRAVDVLDEDIDDVLFISKEAYSQLLSPNTIITQVFKAPQQQDIDRIEFIYDGTLSALEEKRPILEQELSDELSSIPALSLGMQLSTPNGGTVVVKKLLSNGKERFAVAMPQFGVQEIPYEIAPFQPPIGLCANPICTRPATHVCSKCRIALYCDNPQCPQEGWEKSNHKLICHLFL